MSYVGSMNSYDQNLTGKLWKQAFSINYEGEGNSNISNHKPAQ